MVGNGKSFECPIDGRKFSAKKGLVAHQKAMHQMAVLGSPSRGRGGGRGGKRVRNARAPSATSTTRLARGSDILGSFIVKTTNTVGDIIAASPINPQSFPSTRFGREATLFTRWRPKKMVLEVSPTAGAMTSGSYTLGWQADPDDWIDNTPQTPTVIAAMRPSVTKQIAQRCSFALPTKTTQTWYLVDRTEAADSCHGKYYLCISGQMGNITPQSAVNLVVKLHWTVEFDSPSIPRDAAAGSTIYAESGYENYFTDSTNDWASGKKLSLKAHEGGALVPFVGIQPAIVYRLDPAAKLTYNTASGKSSIKYGVRIPNFDGNALAVFASIEKAKQFASTSDTTHCLDYVSAGDVVSPSNPAWAAMPKLRKTAENRMVLDLQQQVVELTRMVHQLAVGGSNESPFQSLTMSDLRK